MPLTVNDDRAEWRLQVPKACWLKVLLTFESRNHLGEKGSVHNGCHGSSVLNSRIPSMSIEMLRQASQGSLIMIIVRLLLSSLLVSFGTTNFTREREPTLSWNQFHSEPRLGP
jgi:hypothetical protein